MKKILAGFLFFSLLIQVIYADTTSTNMIPSCPGEQIEELHSITVDTSHVESGSVTDGSDDYDNYYFTPGEYGTLTLSYSSTDSTDVRISTASCQDDSIANWNNATSEGPITITLNNTDTVYIQIFAQKTANYSISMDFTVTAPPTKDFICANPKPFDSVYKINTNGNLLILGNTSLCADNNIDGTCEDPGTATNNNIYMIDHDADSDAATTINSSAATLNLPADATVLYAGLHWQGYLVNATQARKDSAAAIKFKFDGSTYNTTTVNTTNMNWVYFDASRFYYQGYVNLTSYVQTNGAGKYWVGDIISDTGAGLPGGGFGGWAITVVYKSASETFRNLSVYSGYESIAGATDIANAVAYADANGCDNTNTGVGNDVETTITGFITPKQAPISSRLTVFAGEGDVGIAGDSITLTNKAGTPIPLTNGVNPSNNVMNSSISVDGVYVTSGDPHHSNNSLGIDIDQYDTSLIMNTEQTSTTVTLNTSGDGYFPAVYAFAAELYQPQMCYDYSYYQNNRYFTEENNGTAAPRISGTVVQGDDVNVSIYLRNNELSDFPASNVKMSIRDLNTSQANYVTGSILVAEANQLSPQTPVIDSSGAGFIHGIDEGDIPGLASTFTYFTINPSVSDIDMSLDANISYDLILPDGLGGFLPPIRYDAEIGSTHVPMCPTSGGTYTPTWGAYNIEEPSLAGTNKYNLYTQVVNRPFTFDVVSYDPNNLTIETNSSMFLGIDMIDAGGYHDVSAACNDPEAAISPTLRVHLLNGETRKTVNLNDAVTDGYITSVNEFVQQARENVAFRVSYLVDKNGSGSPIEYDYNPATNVVVMTGFTTVAGQTCAIDPRTGSPKIVQKPNGGDTILAPVACGNAGTTGVTPEVLDQCLQCVTESDVKFECSRDNFSIRPEAFKVAVFDNAESSVSTNPKQKLPFTSNISAGYKYRYDVNATTHTDETGATGYTESYVVPLLDRNITHYWRPAVGQVVSGCNDTTNKNPQLSLSNGYAVNSLNSNNNVGRYELKMRDKTWTKADQSPAHHTTDLTFNGVNYTATDHYNLDDCSLNDSFVPSSATSLDNTNIGCIISSSHTNVDRSGVIYSDYNVTIHPYDFNLSTVTFNKGIDNTVINNNSSNYVYMNNIINDSNMSLRYAGQIQAVGADTVPLNNFVADCYAQDIDLDLDVSALPINPIFNYRLRETNTSNGLIFSDTNGNNGGAVTVATVTIPQANILKNSFGASTMELNLNFDRNVTVAINPIQLTHNGLHVSCNIPTNCESNADMIATHLPDSQLDNNASITYIYGRVHTPRQRVTNPNPANNITATIPLYYEFYCDSATGCNIADYNNVSPIQLSPSGLLSQDDVRWYDQDLHTIATDGNATNTGSRNAAENVNLPLRSIDVGGRTATYTYNGGTNNEGYPYKTTLELEAPDWLIYNRFDQNALVNEFELEFFSTGTFAGQDGSGVNMDANTSINVNRRISW